MKIRVQKGKERREMGDGERRKKGMQIQGDESE